MSNFKERLKKEKDELEDKLVKLLFYLNSKDS